MEAGYVSNTPPHCFRGIRAAGILLAVAWLCLAAAAGNMSAQPARQSPDWFAKGLLYQVQLRAFSPEGTLKGAEARLQHIKDIGATVVYLVPVFKMDEDMNEEFWSPRQIKSGFGNPRNQYRIIDYFHVDPEYGTDADLKDFVAAAHKLGLKVLFDIVYFHMGPTAPILKDRPEFTYWNEDGSVRKGKWRFPQLNFQSRALREYLMANMVYLLAEFGCDGFRCDVGARIPLDFWCEARERVEMFRPETIMLCEGSDPANQTKAFDADYGRFPAPGIFTGTKASARALRTAWEKTVSHCAAGARFVNHYENHDIATDDRPRREIAWTHAGIDQTLVYLFTLDGIPMLFNGNEFAEASPDHSMFGNTPLDWGAMETPEGRERLALVKRLVELRRTVPALMACNGKAGLEWLDVSNDRDTTAFVRRAPGERSVLVVQNWRNETVETTLPQPPDGETLLSRGVERPAPSTLRLAPYGYHVIHLK